MTRSAYNQLYDYIYLVLNEYGCSREEVAQALIEIAQELDDSCLQDSTTNSQ